MFEKEKNWNNKNIATDEKLTQHFTPYIVCKPKTTNYLEVVSLL